MNPTVAAFENGRTFTLESERTGQDTPWLPHARFQGVFMKTLVSSAETNGRFSTHLVHILAGCEIGEHVHATQVELHEVFSGKGFCTIQDRDVTYAAGMNAVIPEGLPHRVQAGEEDLYLKATFVPALG